MAKLDVLRIAGSAAEQMVQRPFGQLRSLVDGAEERREVLGPDGSSYTVSLGCSSLSGVDPDQGFAIIVAVFTEGRPIGDATVRIVTRDNGVLVSEQAAAWLAELDRARPWYVRLLRSVFG